MKLRTGGILLTTLFYAPLVAAGVFMISASDVPGKVTADLKAAYESTVSPCGTDAHSCSSCG